MRHAMTTVSLRLSAEMKRHLEMIAASEGRSLNGLMVYVLARGSRFQAASPALQAEAPPAAPMPPATTPAAIAPVSLNAPCPCGSGKKFKRCCAINR